MATWMVELAQCVRIDEATAIKTLKIAPLIKKLAWLREKVWFWCSRFTYILWSRHSLARHSRGNYASLVCSALFADTTKPLKVISYLLEGQIDGDW